MRLAYARPDRNAQPRCARSRLYRFLRSARFSVPASASRERGRLEPDLIHRLAEQLAVFGLVDGLGVGADHLHAEFLQHADRCRLSAVLSAVWPPMVGSSASGRSCSMILATNSGVIGSI